MRGHDARRREGAARGAAARAHRGLQARERAGQRLGVVVAQIPAGGKLSAGRRSCSCFRRRSTASSRGSSACRSQPRATARRARPRREGRGRPAGGPSPPVAGAGRRRRARDARRPQGEARTGPLNGRLREARAREAVAPRPLGGLGDPDPRAGDELDGSPRASRSSNGGRSSGSPSCSRVTPSAWQSRPGPEQSRRGSSTPRRAAIVSSPCSRLERADRARRSRRPRPRRRS